MPQKNDIHLKNFYRNVLAASPMFLPHQFVITFAGDIPEMIKAKPGDQTSITYYVKSGKVPKIDIKENSVSFLSQKFVVPGGVMYDGTWSVEVMLTNDIIHYDSLYEWQEWFANLKNDGGSSDGHTKAIPNTIAHVRLLDSTLQSEIKDFNLVGVYPTKIPDLKMKYENASNPLSFTCEFCYQYMFEASEGDPLGATQG